MPAKRLAVPLCAALLAATAHAQFSGAPFQVPTSSAGPQGSPDVVGGYTRFVVVWKGQGTSGGSATTGILARRFTAPGVPLGEDQLDDDVNAVLGPPRLAHGPVTGFLVVWAEDNGADANDLDIMARRYDGTSGPVGSPFRVNTLTSGSQGNPAVAGDFVDGFVVVWESLNPSVGPAAHEIYGQRLTALGAPIGGEFLVNQVTTGDQTRAVVAMGKTGKFIVAWNGPSVGGTTGQNVYARRFDTDGTPLGGDFRPHSDLDGDQEAPAISADSSGDFVIAWEGPDGAGDGVFARRYASTGEPLGADFRVNTATTGNQYQVSIAANDLGFLATWTDAGTPANVTDVLGRSFDSDGTPHPPYLVTQAYTTGSQRFSRVGVDTESRLFVIAWQDDGRDLSGTGVYAVKVCLPGDANGNGTTDVTDVLFLVNYLFAGGLDPFGCADVNDDRAVNVTDVLFLINHLFAGGPAPG